ncbi:MAG: metallopeptidase family protein [Chloroflexi bacterium]|nr:metallopeptidase family protein [Chloroflexota bacterium]
MNHIDFDDKVQKVLDELPEELRHHIANVAIVVEELADDETLDAADVDDPYDLFGFYHGIPLTERTHDYGLVLPDKISIYRQPILAACRSAEEIRAMIAKIVRHEIAHYFGIDDERLEELGAY